MRQSLVSVRCAALVTHEKCAYPRHPFGYGGVPKAPEKWSCGAKKDTPLRLAYDKNRSI
jgi:hypothetical protein